MKLTLAMTKALFRCVDGGGVTCDAEEALGLNGAAFWKVIEGLRRRGLINDDYALTEAGAEARKELRRSRLAA